MTIKAQVSLRQVSTWQRYTILYAALRHRDAAGDVTQTAAQVVGMIRSRTEKGRTISPLAYVAGSTASVSTSKIRSQQDCVLT